MVYFVLGEQFKQLAPKFSDLAASEKNLDKFVNPAVAMSSAKQVAKCFSLFIWKRHKSL